MSIKKGTSLLLAFLVLYSSAGLAFNLHYCGGKLARISSAYVVSLAVDTQRNTATPEDCCAIKAKKNESCCKDRVIKSISKTDLIVKTVSFQIDAPFVLQQWRPLNFDVASTQIRPSFKAYHCDAHAPPLYALYSRLIFYA